jgi:ankyrin repeat protein
MKKYPSSAFLPSLAFIIACALFMASCAKPPATRAPAKKYINVFEAIQKGDLSAVKAFMKKDPGAVNRLVPLGSRMVLPLHEALLTKHRDIALWLIGEGADVNAKDDAGETPLESAILYSDKDMVALLIDRGADVNLQGMAGFSPLERACTGNERIDVVRLLIEKGAQLDTQDNAGATALMSACGWELKESAALLLEKGAKVTVRDSSGKTALDYALLGKNKEIVAMLKAHGAQPGAPVKKQPAKKKEKP